MGLFRFRYHVRRRSYSGDLYDEFSGAVQLHCPELESRFYIAENEEQFDKTLKFRKDTPHLEKVIVMEMEGLKRYQDPLLMSFDDLLKVERNSTKKIRVFLNSVLTRSNLAIWPFSSIPPARQVPQKGRCSPIGIFSL